MMYLNLSIDDGNHHFEKYLALIQSAIESDQQKLDGRKKYYDEIRPTLSINESNDFDEDIGYLAYEAYELEQVMYHSFVMSIFMFIEAKISHLCEHLFKNTNQKFRHKELAGNGVTRSIRYLEKILGIEFLLDDKLRQEFEIVRIIRNSIVHVGGSMHGDDKKKIQEYIIQDSSKLGFYDDVLSIKYNYVKGLISLNEKVCVEISNHWKEEFV